VTVLGVLCVVALVGGVGYAVLAHIKHSDASWLHDRERRNKNWWWGRE
jgi:hypothetical protein